ncbi:CPBP family intramembrane metalloprotease [Amycolatopsis acidicola]|uniref:CPBP family intramembrane metalloprotease n=1 Tax=Amycolatopsis acidicola TaxID=2596893 RepID=A0A5N0V1U3_9PSEU|nr:CPBP family intramembrane glutamic endopeptidase [Amycolatopsis acidicola]KAA9157158.1 CPBP family intramembrane metalloprotease [Amycolatopsis acidicola]
MATAITTTKNRTPLGVTAGAVGLLLVNSLAVQLAGTWQVAAGASTTVLLFVLAWACRGRWDAATDLVLALGALSVFGWVSAALTGSWAGTLPVAVAFLVVNAFKLSSVALLAVIAARRRWSRENLLIRVGSLNARSPVPLLRWGLLGPIVIVAVLVLFLSDPAVLAKAGPGTVRLVLAWLPVMLAGAVVNALCEELLYRHALIGTARPLLGTAGAVVMSCAVFGAGHITGSPGGLTGVLFTAAYGAVCAAAMLQNRGMAWNLVIHVFGDLGAVSALLIAAG